MQGPQTAQKVLLTTRQVVYPSYPSITDSSSCAMRKQRALADRRSPNGTQRAFDRSELNRAPQGGKRGHTASLLQAQRLFGNQRVQRLLSKASLQRQEDPLDTTDRGPFDVAGEQVFQRGNELLAEGRYRSAIVRFERARQLPDISERSRANCLWNIAHANLQLRRFATAMTYGQQYIETATDASPEDLAEAERLINRARRGAGIPADEERGEYDESQARRLFQYGVRMTEEGNRAQAIIIFERVRQTPGVPESSQANCLWNIGLLNLEMRRFATAISYLEQWLDTGQGTAEDAAGADRLLVRAREGAGIAVEPEDEAHAETLFNRGNEYLEAGEYGTAITFYESARTAPGRSRSIGNCLWNIALAYERLGKPQIARRYIRQYVQTEEADAEAARAFIARLAGARPGVRE